MAASGVEAKICTCMHARRSAMLARSGRRGGRLCEGSVSEKSRKVVVAKKRGLRRPRAEPSAHCEGEPCARARARPRRPGGRPSSLVGCSSRGRRSRRPPARSAASRRAGKCAQGCGGSAETKMSPTEILLERAVALTRCVVNKSTAERASLRQARKERTERREQRFPWESPSSMSCNDGRKSVLRG